MKLRLLVAVLVVAGFTNLSPRASAELLGLNYQGETTSPGNPFLAVSANGQSFSHTPPGPFYWSQNQSPPNANFPPPIATFCIELSASQVLPPLGSNVLFDVVSPSASPTIGNDPLKIAAIAELYGRYYDFAWNDKNTFHGSVASAAFQLALWELVYDGAGGKNLASGNFQAPVPDAYTTTAQNMLNSLNGSNAFETNLGGYELVALLAPATSEPTKPQNQIQDQLLLKPKPVPAPPAALLAGIGVLALVGRARFARRSAATA
ncbi:hypothetical protein R5W24_003877 [Gemmata sp. JC717]|uniref:hypothetical protein n=1 Tax=Gemmata algarum TaxID=2975278 RepID=UPI0021BAD235|nr:hypothetical protein [Gemmata algarum]MDY3554748.1 hypothetical protein [Gemmata algarum]